MTTITASIPLYIEGDVKVGEREAEIAKFMKWFDSLPPVHEGHAFTAQDKWERDYCPGCGLYRNPL